MTPVMESRGTPAPSPSPGRLAAAGWGSRAVIRFTSAALCAIARLAATPLAARCADGRSRLRSGADWAPGRPPKRPQPPPSWSRGLAAGLADSSRLRGTRSAPPGWLRRWRWSTLLKTPQTGGSPWPWQARLPAGARCRCNSATRLTSWAAPAGAGQPLSLIHI
eukprot:12855860-Alexandrium_andersonii.AAC.1